MHLFSLTCNDFTAAARSRWRTGTASAVALYRRVFGQGNPDLAAATVPAQTGPDGKALQDAFDSTAPDIAEVITRNDAAKIIFSLADGQRVESVLLPMPRRSTLCISSQAGCRMGCAFCHTGSLGLRRNLLAEEIVGQVYAVRHGLGRAVDNVVFMGMGEPLDNFDNVAQAIRVLSDQRGLSIPHSSITVSTAGLPDGIKRLGELGWPRLNLAVSLNAAENGLRSRLMPVNRRYPLETLKQALACYPLKKKGVFLIEYVLLRGLNDSRAHAAGLARFLEGLPVRVNVIGYNPGAHARFESPGQEGCRLFCSWLAGEGVFVRMRSSRGQDILAACGQLGGTARDVI